MNADWTNIVLAIVGIGLPTVGYVAWLIRLEEVSKQNTREISNVANQATKEVDLVKQDLIVVKAKVDILEDKVMGQLIEIKVTLAKIMGRLNIDE